MDHDANTTTAADPATPTRRPRRRLVAALVAGGVLVGGGAAYAATVARSAGPDYVYGSPHAFSSATATVKVATSGKGSSTVTLKVRGVDAPAGQTFGAHVHQLPCGELPADSGGHYAHAGAAGTLQSREVWLDVTVKANGTGRSTAVRPWVLDESTPRSVVIHALPTDPATGVAGARLACIDLDGVA